MFNEATMAQAMFQQGHHKGADNLLKIVSAHATAEQTASVKTAIEKAKAAGVPWIKIIITIMPFILGILSGGTLDIAALVAAIMSLFQNQTS